MSDQEKKCSKCQKTFPLRSFHKDRNRYRPECKTCRNQFRKSPEERKRHARYMDKWTKDPKSRKKYLAARSRYTKTEKSKKAHKRYLRSPKGQRFLKRQEERRLEAIRRATPPWADLEAIKQVYAEAERLTRETGVKHEVHHIIPILECQKYVMGLHVPENLEILTAKQHREAHRLIKFCARTTWQE